MSNSPPTKIFKPLWVANTFLDKAKEDGIGDMTPLKLQKLIYCLHGWNLAVTGHPAIGERFEAWPHGPVVRSVYHAFKGYKYHRIYDFATDVDPETGQERALVVSDKNAVFFDVFDRVWDRYKRFDAQELSDMTHQPNTPWSYARENGNAYLSDTMIKDHFIELSKATT